MWDGLVGRFRGRKKEPPPRRSILEDASGILGCPEAVERIARLVKKYPPGTALRWQKLLPAVNTNEEPTEENPDPIRVAITQEVLFEVLREMYQSKRSIQSDGLALAREFIPLMYDKHTVERAMNVSQRERDQRGITDECYAYGELDHEIFAALYLRVVSVFGERSKGTFCDLGCGVGTLVYTAAYIGEFERVVGVENIAALLERGERRAGRWERFKGSYNERLREVIFDWIEDDFLLNGFWTVANFIVLHWTAFSNAQRRDVAALLATCAEGTYVVSFTHPIPGKDFEILVHDTCVTSWGKSDFFFQEKVTPAKKRML